MTKETRYLIYRAGASQPETVVADLPCKMTFEQLEQLIRPLVGGSIEHKTTVLSGREADLFVYQFAYPEGFEPNDAATSAFRIPIRGTAVVFDRIVYHREHPTPRVPKV